MNPASDKPTAVIADRSALWLCATICVAAAVLRIIPATGDFWFDEIWTYNLVRPLDSPVEIFNQIHHSNNNYLNSLLFYWIGDRENWVWYRIPSLAAGIASVPLACMLAGRHSRLEAIFAGLLTGGCFALIHFSSEARGYSLAVFFALTATWLLEQDLGRPRAARTVAFAVCVILGFLSHLVFLFYFAAAVAQSSWRLMRSSGARCRAARHLVCLHGPALVALFALYWVDLRYLRVGGGNATDWSLLTAGTVGYALGLPVRAEYAVPYIALTVVIAAAGLRLSWRRGDDEWVLLSVSIFLAPMFVLAVLHPKVVAVRYFLIGIAFFLLLASRTAAELYRAGGWRRALCVAGVGIFLIGNAGHVAAFYRFGRGGYGDALRYMAESSHEPGISIGSDHDFRNGMLLRFYARTLPEDRHLIYHEHGNWPRIGPEWFILHADRRPDLPKPWVRDGNGNRYEFARDFDHAAISGFWWGIYRNVSRDASEAGEPQPRKLTPPERLRSP